MSALGGIHVLAFLSLALQVEGLIGSRGILPARDLLDAVATFAGPERYWGIPSVFWLGSSDAVLKGACFLGAAIGAALALRVAPIYCLTALWVLYLSLTAVGGVFLAYQWDTLLLEATFFAILVAPRGLWPQAREPSRLGIWLLRFLLFRLVFASGLAKLASGDPTWRGLSALAFHYETQPLPTWIAWSLHQLPLWVHRLTCAAMLAIELVAAPLALGPRRARLLALGPLVALQLAIALSGNYGFFNLLTLVLCLPLLDDSLLPGWLGTRPLAAARPDSWPRRGIALAFLLLGGTAFVGSFLPLPQPLAALHRLTAPLRTFNGYGLFAVMTTVRPEIAIEGRRQGGEWRSYVFDYKPGDPAESPAFVAPYQPRLDWQMWFAALGGDCRASPWFPRFLDRLRQGSPAVVALLRANPFPEGPPDELRSRRLDYRFTTAAERRVGQGYWRVSDDGPFCDAGAGSGEVEKSIP